MEKNIKDYLHLYLGCEVICPDPFKDEGVNTRGYLTGIHGEHGPEIQLIEGYHASENPEYFDYSQIKLIVRPLSSMTEGEGNELENIGHNAVLNKFEINRFHAERIKYLLSKGFDLFGLIEAGLAIEKKLATPINTNKL